MVKDIIPGLAERLLAKGADYGEVFKELGVKGQYSDMHRKMYKLKKALWDGEPLYGEQAEEILQDLFGNILITLYLLEDDRLNAGRESNFPEKPTPKHSSSDVPGWTGAG